MSNNQDTDVCCICLCNAQARGGEFLVTPGCCGKWFHQSCINELKANGVNECPACRAAFPGSSTSGMEPIATASTYEPICIPFGAYPAGPTTIAFGPASVPPQYIPRASTRRSLNRSAHIDPAMLVEDTPIQPRSASASVEDSHTKELKVTIIPEYPTIATTETFPFYAHVRIEHLDNGPKNLEDGPRNGIDVMCILDISGSMSGAKIENLKHAIYFIYTTLHEHDRLAIVTFHSSARVIHHYKNMNAENKDASRRYVESIDASGGTDIYDGMRKGWDLLNGRQGKEQRASSVFILTDGQDPEREEEKIELARQMRSQGSSLFFFGFGADHDAAHMNKLANSAEGSFIYVESNDAVIDAFGGAIGSQQGSILRDVTVDISLPPSESSIRIEAILSGKYQHILSADRRSGSVKYADLYSGERRDFLVKLFIPLVPQPVEVYPILHAKGRYRLISNDDRSGRSASTYEEVDTVVSNVERIQPEAYQSLSLSRDIGVDTELIRLQATQTLEECIKLADQGRITEAQTLLTNIHQVVLNSLAYRSGNRLIVELLREITDAQRAMTNEYEYAHKGGKALVTESMSTYTYQRSTYNKKASNVYQNSSSSAFQSRATASKSKF
jgi:Mg-chelatase subunit ChlD